MLFELKKRYNFSTKAPALLGAEYRNMKVESIMSSTEAIKYLDILTLHEQVKTIIGLDIEPINCTFIKFKSIEGDEKIIALEYINSDSIVEVETINIQINILNANTNDMLILSERLRELGYDNFKMKTFN